MNKTKNTLFILLYFSVLYCGIMQSPETHNHNLMDIGEFGFPNNPLEDRAKGFILSGKQNFSNKLWK